MESDTATKKNRWLRLGTGKTDLPEFDQLMDLYWSGKERRISTLTVKIIGVNALALILLMIGILFLGQSQQNLIESQLENFNTEIQLISLSLSEGAIENGALNAQASQRIINRLYPLPDQTIQVFDIQGHMIAQRKSPPQKIYSARMKSVEVLKDMTRFVLKLIPSRQTLPFYPADAAPDIQGALSGKYSLSAWLNPREEIFLSGTAPLIHNGELSGAVILTRTAYDIHHKISALWANILGAFALTLILTILLSIYLSGVIASPLRRLAKTAEGLRRGKLGVQDIPDLSDRNDEIGELSTAIREMTEALMSRMDTIERFAADVAHELKNPLTSLRSAVETLQVVKKKADREKLMGIITHDIERLERLISDISHASRIDAALSRERYQPIHVERLLQQFLEHHDAPLERKTAKPRKPRDEIDLDGVTLKLDLPARAGLHIWGEETRLLQVFDNLLSNARSFSKAGDVITIRLAEHKNRVRITFEDQGKGIPEDKLEEIFERFYTQRPDHEDYGRHSGLGLSICRQIIQAMNGQIYAENIHGANGAIEGARFVVVLEHYERT